MSGIYDQNLQATDVTRSRLAEVECASNWLGTHVTSYTRKRWDAPLTATERRVSDMVPIDLGFVSQPLLYARPVRTLSKPERKALYSLLARGFLNVYRYQNPDREEIR